MIDIPRGKYLRNETLPTHDAELFVKMPGLRWLDRLFEHAGRDPPKPCAGSPQ